MGSQGVQQLQRLFFGALLRATRRYAPSMPAAVAVDVAAPGRLEG